MIGDPVPEVFSPDDPAARFVVAMSMARNDVERAFHDLVRSEDENRQDFTYRVRLVTGHLVEAIDSLGAYRGTFAEVRKLLAHVSVGGQKDLKVVSGTLQKAGQRALQDVRDNTFHYPSPDKAYSPTSDEQLRDVLALMSDRGVSFHFDGDSLETTMSFADDASLDLAMGRPTTTASEALRRSEIARDGALAFLRWVNALIEAYVKTNDLAVGDPIVTPKQEPSGG
jgi:hypothetical protein